MEFTKELNSPLAIVALLSVIFGFLTMAIDKLFYFLRGVNKTTPMDKMAGSFEGLKTTMEETQDVLSEIAESAKLLNEQMKHQADVSNIKMDQLLHEIRQVRGKIDD